MNERTIRRFRGAAAVLLLAPVLAAQSSGTLEPGRIEVVLERNDGSQWSAVDARTVLNSGDRIRFRFKSTLPGWLYVHYAGSGGETGLLLPQKNEIGHRILGGETYQVPAGAGSFTVAGPPGFDVLYWVLSPKPVPAESLLPPSAKRAPRTLIPRCRGQLSGGTESACLDDRAGPAAVEASQLAPLRRSSLRARELRIGTESGVSTIEPADRSAGIIIYEFRLAHR
jgi:hypothetical protein